LAMQSPLSIRSPHPTASVDPSGESVPGVASSTSRTLFPPVTGTIRTP
jgi:hypothetical protein